MSISCKMRLMDRFRKRYEARKKEYWARLEQCYRADSYKLYQALLETTGVVWLAGNGGSLFVASHAALDLTKFAGKHALAVGDPGVITAYSNDISFEHGIAEYLAHLWSQGDLFIALSTSGESPNIITAAKEAKRRLIRSCGLTTKGSTLSKEVDLALEFEEKSPQALEDVFQVIFHFLSQLLRKFA